MDDGWVTYRLANGDQVWDEYAFVVNTEFFEDVDRPTEVIKETWTLVASETIIFGGEDATE